MNEDEKNPDLQPWIEPELEARVVAAVLGEASAFERAEVERLIAEQPELAIFKRRIEAVHGLAAEAVRSENPPLRMEASRRERLLAMIGGARVAESKVTVLPPARFAWLTGGLLTRVAAGLVIGGLTATFLMTLSTYRDQESAAGMQVHSWKEDQRFDNGMVAVEESKIPAQPAGSPRPLADGNARKAGGDWEDGWRAKQAEGAAQVADKSVSGTVQTAAPAAAKPVDRLAASPIVVQSGQRAEIQVIGEIPAAGAVLPSELQSASGNFAAAARAPMRAMAGDLSVDATELGATTRADDTASDRSKDVASRRQTESGGTRVAQAEADAASITLAGGGGFGYGAPVTAGVSNSLVGADAGAGIRDFNETRSRHPLSHPAGNREASTAIPATPLAKEKASAAAEIAAEDQPFSTFSLHVSDVSFLLAKDALDRGERPDPARIRAEEFYNAFDYGDPAPAAMDEVTARIEQSAHPFRQQRNLVRIAVKVAATGRPAAQPLRLTILLDTSGSMEREDRAASVARALEALASLLGPHDRVTLIGFARQPRLLAEELPGDQAGRLAEIAARTPSEGGTNLEQALRLAGELARRQRLPAAQNRVVLLTDGAANLGDAKPAQLAGIVEGLRAEGIAFDACGVGAKGLNDEILEALTRKGDGRYYFLEKPADADAGFARQLAGAFRPAAENVKVQVRFNPRRVGKYRLLGFEDHRLAKEDFRDDKVDAAELAAAEAGVAVYEVEPRPDGEGELGEVFVRFRDPAGGVMVERSWTMPYDAQAPAFDRASPSQQLAGVAALLGEKLRGGPAAQAVELDTLLPVASGLVRQYPHQTRVAELLRMVRQAKP